MGEWKMLKNVNIDDIEYFITAGSGFPYLVTANHTFIDAYDIFDSNINPVQIVRKKSVAEGKYTEAVYHSNPLILVFYSYKDFNIFSDISIFNTHFKSSLNCDYVIGFFNHSSGFFPNNESYMSANKCFSVALFNKTLDEIIDFAVSYVHKTKRIGALIVGKNLTSDTITVESDEFLSLCNETL